MRLMLPSLAMDVFMARREKCEILSSKSIWKLLPRLEKAAKDKRLTPETRAAAAISARQLRKVLASRTA